MQQKKSDTKSNIFSLPKMGNKFFTDICELSLVLLRVALKIVFLGHTVN